MGSYAYIDVARAEMIPFIPESATTVLDVGCGRGGFGQALRRQRPELHVTGIESDVDIAHTAASRYHHVICGEFPAVVPATAFFDCIVFNDVLEHMVDPWAALTAAGERLSEDGVVVVSLPNLRYWRVLKPLIRNGEFTYRADGVMDRTHLRFFTRRSAVSMLADSGFETVTWEPINQLGFEELTPRERLLFRVISWMRRPLVDDLRAQQYAFLARPTAGPTDTKRSVLGRP